MLRIPFKPLVFVALLTAAVAWGIWWVQPGAVQVAALQEDQPPGQPNSQFCGLAEPAPFRWQVGYQIAAASAGKTENNRRLVIDTEKREITLFEGGKVLKRFPVAIGTPKNPSPIGEWRIVHKSRNWGGGFGTRWLGLNVPWGIYGVHGTNKPYSIGTAASHGCFRMHNRNVEELFPEVPLGTPIAIIGPEPRYRPRQQYKSPVSGQDVVILQKRIREHGFALGYADGRFGKDSEKAVKELEAFYGLPVDGVADRVVQQIVGFRRDDS